MGTNFIFSLSELDNFIGNATNFLNVALNHISLLQELRRFHKTANSRRCTGQDHISREQSTEFGTPSHNFIGIKDKLFGAWILFGFSIDFAGL